MLPLELVAQQVAQLEQVPRVLCRIVQHAGRQRAHAPVGALVLLVQLEPEVLLQQRRKAEGGEAEELRRDPRVEDVRHPPAVVLVQEAQVVVSVVKDDFDPRVFHQPAQRRRRAEGQRVDDGAALIRGELQQVDAIHELVKARPLGVQRDRVRRRDRGHEGLDVLGGVEVVEWVNVDLGHWAAARAQSTARSRKSPPGRREALPPVERPSGQGKQVVANLGQPRHHQLGVA